MNIIDKPQKSNTKNFNVNLNIKNESSNNVLSVRDLTIGYNNIPLYLDL